MDIIIESLPNMLGEQYIQNLTKIFVKVAEGFPSIIAMVTIVEFHEVSKSAMTALVNFIYADLAEALAKIYTKEWTEKQVVKPIIATLEDYFEEISQLVAENYFRKLVKNKC
jgi:hypothetical protein